MKTVYTIEKTHYGHQVTARTTDREGRQEEHSEGTHKTRAAAAKAVRGMQYAAAMASADGHVRPRGI